MIAKLFEKALLTSRLLILLPVLFSLVGAIVLFVIASIDIVAVVFTTLSYYTTTTTIDIHADGVAMIIGAIDLYLIAVVLLIFSFGLYELFISWINGLEEIGLKGGNILTIETLDQLKDKLAKVIIMVLVVSFFQRVLHMDFSTPLEMLYLSGSILLLALGLYFLSKGH